MKIGSILLAGLLVATIFVITGNTPAKTSFAEEEIREPDRTAAPSASNSAAGDPGQVVIASGNNRFAVWSDATPGNSDIFFRRSTDNGATWQPIVNLSNNPGTSGNAQITVVGAKVYVVWAQENAAETTVDAFFIRSLDNGANWGPKVRISTSDTDSFDFTNPQVAASGAFVYITWIDFGARDAFFRRSINSGGTFQGVINISNSGTADYLNIAALAAAGTNVYVAWDDFFATKDILLKRSTNNGATWSSVKNLSNGGGFDAKGPELAATTAYVYAGWSDRISVTSLTEAYFARSTNSGGTFSAKVNLSNNAGSSGPPQIAFSGAFVFVTWHDDTPGNFDVLMKRSINNGGSFQAVKNLSNNAGTSIFPQVATSGSNVYFTWNDNTPGNNDIFLRRSNNNGGTLQPLVQISNNAGVSVNPQVTTVGSNVYIIWQDDTPGNYDIIERRSHDNGATWKPTQNLSTNSGQSIFPQIDG